MNRIKLLLLVFTATAFATLSSCDKCRKVACLNGGECVDGDCQCQEGYYGETCNQKDVDKFIGTWNGLEDCSTTTSTFTLTIVEGSVGTDTRRINITGLYRYTGSVYAIVDDESFDIPAQDFGISTIHGSGVIDGTNLTITYYITGGGNYDECVFTGEKQF